MHQRVYTLLFSLVAILLSTLGVVGQTTQCDTIELADRTVYVVRGEKDSQIEVAKKSSNEKEADAPLYQDRVWSRSGGSWDRLRSSSVHKNDGKPVIYKQFVDKISYHFVCSFGWNLFTASEWSSKGRFWGSIRGDVGLYTILPIGSSPWALNTGVSLVGSRYAFDKAYAMQRNDDGQTVLRPDPNDMGYSCTTLSLISIELPVGLSLSWGETNAWSSLSVVPKIICMQRSHTRSLDERVRTLVDDDLNVRPFGLDLRGEIGYRNIGLFGRISVLNTIPTKQAEVRTRDYSLGLIFRF